MFCIEGLSAILHHVETQWIIRGVAICKGAPKLSHLLLAGDSHFFFWASVSESNVILNVLNSYEKALGQHVNIDKSVLLFSANTPIVLKEAIMSQLGVSKIMARDRYLGMPIMIGRVKKR